MSSSSSAPDLPANLPSLLATRYESAIASGSAFFYPSEVHRIEQSAGNVKLQWTVRRCEALRQKAQEKAKKEKEKDERSSSSEEAKPSAPQQGGGQNPTDVFSPPYDPQLLVAEVGKDHALLLNKFALIPQHFLLVTTAFRSQALPPPPETLALSYRILASLLGSADGQRLCFFNCGPDSGASQPHCHMQFVDLKEGGGVLVEELLDRVERDGKEMETVHALPLPYQHFVHLLPPSLKSSSPDEIEGRLGMALMKLLDAMFSAQSAAMAQASDKNNAAAAADPPRRSGKASWNLLLTPRAMHLIPRSQEEFPLDKEGSPSAEVGPLSLNALCFAGHLVTKSNEEVQRIQEREGGVAMILAEVGRSPVADITVQATGTEGVN